MFSSWADSFKESITGCFFVGIDSAQQELVRYTFTFDIKCYSWNFHWQPTFLATTLASTVSLHHLQTKTSLQMGEQSYLQSIVFQQVKFIIIGEGCCRISRIIDALVIAVLADNVTQDPVDSQCKIYAPLHLE